MSKLLTITLSHREARAVINALRLADASDRIDKADRVPITWVAMRIGAALGLTVAEFANLQKKGV